MTTRLLLEGADLAELMAHVRSELGPTARIVRAERIRSGGFGGFFARERYEITVDVPPEPVAKPRAALRAVPEGGMAALLAAADEADAGLDGAPDRSELPAGRLSSRSEFAAVLEKVSGLVDGDVPDLPDGEERAALVATAGTAMPAVTAEAVAALVSRTVVPEPEPDPVPFVPLAAVPDRAPDRVADAAPGGDDAHDDGLHDALAEIGVPRRLLTAPRVTLSSVLADLPAAPPVPRAPGSVLVVIGADDDADAVAALLAERLRLSPDAVRPAGGARPRTAGRTRAGARMASPDQVATWRAGATSADHPWVVALAVGPEPEDRAAAAALVRACEPDQVWAVVDARTRTADARRWIRSVTSSVDAVAMRGLLDTAEPGAALALGIPVAWIDGVPATTVAWAAALSQALGDTARWD
ncbi:hypothetical protein Cch01nite_33660 [Cellulomonas chitinilytica]|uniref:Uncharacterized protein n=1 Tax=Cellulomonas chitinilytica TaxID=398759 RepID=A0A919U3P9_9CELL|nr:hypothetical protein [Cellulomonas chitinilytica]GIG22642.1 hypothetical protein Cch01nite_33660 [Cellulomonas chitinilytica]